MEEELRALDDLEGGGFTTKFKKQRIRQVEATRRRILEEKKALQWLKHRVFWLESEEEIPNFSKILQKGRKVSNTIWAMTNQEGGKAAAFDEKPKLRKNHFNNLFKAQTKSLIVEVVQLVYAFPLFANGEDNI